jgi:hypothetical protein
MSRTQRPAAADAGKKNGAIPILEGADISSNMAQYITLPEKIQQSGRMSFRDSD